MATLLGIDYGAKRTGLAVGDDQTRLPSPVKTITTDDPQEQLESVVRVAEDFDVSAFVLGLPLNMDGTEGPQAGTVRRFGGTLAARTGKPVHYVDERLSSYAADDLLRPAELTRKKKKGVQDAVAASVILATYFEQTDGAPHDEPQ